MSESLGFELKPQPDTSLSQMIEYGLSKHLDRYDSPCGIEYGLSRHLDRYDSPCGIEYGLSRHLDRYDSLSGLEYGLSWYSQNSKKTLGVPIITVLPRLYKQCTNSVPIIKNSQKTAKTTTNHHWCTNRHSSTKTVQTVYQQCTNRQKQSKDSQNSTKMTIGVPIVTCLHRVRRIHKAELRQCTSLQTTSCYIISQIIILCILCYDMITEPLDLCVVD